MLRSFVGSGVSIVVSWFALAGCGSSVDLCGGGAVCGIDGRSYTDRCAAEHARVEIAYLGACAVECPAITCEVACPFGFLRDASGCEICTCAECSVTEDCSDPGTVCQGGRCENPGVDAGVPDAGEPGPPDAGPFDAGGVDPEDGGVCPDGLDPCGERCFDLDTSLAHCGECFETCANETRNPGVAMCVEGDCEARGCVEGFTDCDGEGSTGCEVNIRVDEDHCGACGNSCDSDQLCRGSECRAITEVCRDPAEWTVEDERIGYCRAKCADEVVEIEGLLGNCGLLSTSCSLTGVVGTCEQRAARCCFGP